MGAAGGIVTEVLQSQQGNGFVFTAKPLKSMVKINKTKLRPFDSGEQAVGADSPACC